VTQDAADDFRDAVADAHAKTRSPALLTSISVSSSFGTRGASLTMAMFAACVHVTSREIRMCPLLGIRLDLSNRTVVLPPHLR
jgi:hypothetical protein